MARPAPVASVFAVRATAAPPAQAQLVVYSDTLTPQRSAPDIPGSISIYVPQPPPIDDDGQEVDGFDPAPAPGLDRSLVGNADQFPGGSCDSSKASPKPPQNRGTLTRHNLIPHVVALTALDAPGTITAGDSDPKDPETYLTVWSSL